MEELHQDLSGKTILALETAAPVCSVALHHNGKTEALSAIGTGIHSEKTFLFISELLEKHNLKVRDLDAVVISSGPGSYTGLRIASSAVKGLLFGTDIRLIQAETLAGIAVGALKQSGRVHAVLNARRTHLYHQLFERKDGGRLEALSEARVLDISDIKKKIKTGDTIAGTGIQRLGLSEEYRQIHTDEAMDARNLIKLLPAESGNFWRQADPESFEPAYQVPGAG